jgi:hypothetical protein
VQQVYCYPRLGTQQEWDLIGRAEMRDGREEWLLVEAKAHCGEIRCDGTAARGPGRAKIEAALQATKEKMEIPPEQPWAKRYYQYANRITTLHFLNENDAPARMIFMYFCGDSFGNSKCPPNKAGWESVITAVKKDLGLLSRPAESHLTDRIHEMFIHVSPS